MECKGQEGNKSARVNKRIREFEKKIKVGIKMKNKSKSIKREREFSSPRGAM